MAKRCRLTEVDSVMPPGAVKLLDLPQDLLQCHLLPLLGGLALARLEATSRVFRSALSTERAAEDALLAACGGCASQAARWRGRSWKERLHVEDSFVGFDPQASAEGFDVHSAGHLGKGSTIALAGMGPKLLTSDLSTAGGRTLRWRLQVRGNTAVEFGVVPEALRGVNSALHKQLAVDKDSSQRAVGICSQITAGSNLPIRAPIMHATIVEVVARRGRVEFLLKSDENGREMHWVNGQAVARPYRGPKEVRMEQDFPAHFDVRLALTSWAKASFDVLHPEASPAAKPAVTVLSSCLPLPQQQRLEAAPDAASHADTAEPLQWQLQAPAPPPLLPPPPSQAHNGGVPVPAPWLLPPAGEAVPSIDAMAIDDHFPAAPTRQPASTGCSADGKETYPIAVLHHGDCPLHAVDEELPPDSDTAAAATTLLSGRSPAQGVAMARLQRGNVLPGNSSSPSSSCSSTGLHALPTWSL